MPVSLLPRFGWRDPHAEFSLLLALAIGVSLVFAVLFCRSPARRNPMPLRLLLRLGNACRHCSLNWPTQLSPTGHSGPEPPLLWLLSGRSEPRGNDGLPLTLRKQNAIPLPHRTEFLGMPQLRSIPRSEMNHSNRESSSMLLRTPAGSCALSSRSTSSCVLFHTGNASASSVLPSSVRIKIRFLRSDLSCSTLNKPRRSSGFNAAVKVVRSIASSSATGAIGGGTGRFSDTRSENCPLVKPNGRSTSSKRRASARAARCTCRHKHVSLTSKVASNGNAFLLDTSSQ